MQKITIEFEESKWLAIVNHLQLTANVDYAIKSVRIKDDMFKDDETYHLLKKKADKGYKELETYCYNKRHNIKK